MAHVVRKASRRKAQQIGGGQYAFMNGLRIGSFVAAGWLSLGVLASVFTPPGARAATEEKFDALQIGSHTYRNVTVTTKSKNYVFLIHSEGLATFKVAELPSEVLQQLGYQESPATKGGTKLGSNVTANVTALAKQTLTRLETPEVKSVEASLLKTWADQSAAARRRLPPITPTFLLIVAASVMALYLFYCYCCMLICQKAGQQPGVLVWLPVLQAFPLLKAARMSGWWFLAFFVPVLNLVTHILWCFKISDARGKTPLIGILLILPGLNILAFLFLAFSSGQGQATQQRKKDRPIEIMTLETA